TEEALGIGKVAPAHARLDGRFAKFTETVACKFQVTALAVQLQNHFRSGGGLSHSWLGRGGPLRLHHRSAPDQLAIMSAGREVFHDAVDGTVEIPQAGQVRLIARERRIPRTGDFLRAAAHAPDAQIGDLAREVKAATPAANGD